MKSVSLRGRASVAVAPLLAVLVGFVVACGSDASDATTPPTADAGGGEPSTSGDDSGAPPDRKDAGGDAGRDAGAGLVLKVAAGVSQSCALLQGGRVVCWGANSFGQAGQGDTNARGDEPNEIATLAPIALGAGRVAVDVTAGGLHACARFTDGSVKCWGNNAPGALGLGDEKNRGDKANEMGDALPTVNLGAGRTAIAVAAGGFHTCAITDLGTVKCWGANQHGQLGAGDTAQHIAMGASLPDVPLGTGRTAKSLCASEDGTCVVLDDGSAKCWGLNDYGELGQGDKADRGVLPGQMGDALPAIALGTGRSAKALACSLRHTCALLDDGTVKCWGANVGGALGQGDANARGDEPNEMGDALAAIALGGKATAITVGQYRTCAVLESGALKCWGYNFEGHLGVGDKVNRGDKAGDMAALAPIDLGPGRTALGVAAGWEHTCARLDDGTVKCWGLGNAGQLGLGDKEIRGDAPGEMGAALPVVPLGP